MRRVRALGALVAALGIALAWAGDAPPRPDGDDRAAVEVEAYAFGATDAGYVAANPAQGFRSTFSSHGVDVRPTDGAGWTLALELAAWGRPGSMAPAPPATGTAASALGRLDLRRGPVTEWFRNDRRGLEQSFDVAHRPAGPGPVVLELAAAGLTPRMGDGRVELVAEAGGAVLGYGGLYAEDAAGRPLPAMLGVAGDRITLTVDDRGASYPILVDPLLYTLEARGVLGDDFIGDAVAIDGDTAIVGADQADRGAGAAYVFVRTGGTWTLQQRLSAPVPLPRQGFGVDVAIDGDTIVVGAQSFSVDDSPGSAYVFVRSGAAWTFQAEIRPAGTVLAHDYGAAVDLDGDTAVVTALTSDTATPYAAVFVRSGTTWTEQAILTSFATFSGYSVAVSGDTIVGSGPDRLVAWVRTGGTWTEQPMPSVPGVLLMGGSNNDGVDIDGDTAIAGEFIDAAVPGDEGTIFVFVRIGGVWTQQAALVASDREPLDNLGHAVAIEGDLVIGGARNADGSGAAYVFRRDGTTWSEEAKLLASDRLADGEDFGNAVAISGGTAMVGAPSDRRAETGQGAAYAFVRSGTSWAEQAKLVSFGGGDPGDRLGAAVAAAGDVGVVVGLPGDGVGANGDRAGAAAGFVRSGSVWAGSGGNEIGTTGDRLGTAAAANLSIPTIAVGAPGDDVSGVDAGAVLVDAATFVRAGDGDAGDRFGAAVALDASVAPVAVFGAPGDDQARGAAYVFERPADAWTETAKLVAPVRGADDAFGAAVGASGDTLVIGAPGDDTGATGAGAAYVFTGSGSSWTLQATLTGSDADDAFGHAVAISADTIAVSAPGDGGGTVRVFARSGTTWSEQDELEPSGAAAGDDFGWSLSLVGDDLLVGAPGEDAGRGAAYAYAWDGTGWFELDRYVAPGGAAGDAFGWSVSIGTGIAAVGAPGEDADAGAVYFYGTTPMAAASIGDAVVDEDAGSATLAVTLTEPAASDVTVDYETVDGTAHAPDDYTATSGQAVIPATETAASIVVDIADDVDDETEETLTVRLTAASGALLADRDGTASITDDDEAPVVTTTTLATTTTTRRGLPPFPTTTTTRPRSTTTTTTAPPTGGPTTTTAPTAPTAPTGPPPTADGPGTDPGSGPGTEVAGAPPRLLPLVPRTTVPNRPTTPTTTTGPTGPGAGDRGPGDDAKPDDGDVGDDDADDRNDADDRRDDEGEDGGEDAAGAPGGPGGRGGGEGTDGDADGAGGGGTSARGEPGGRGADRGDSWPAVPELVESVITPSQVSTDAGLLAQNLLVLTPILILLVTFPGALFNSTMGAHYDEISRWFGRDPDKERTRTRPRLHVAYVLLVFTPVTALVSCFVSPDFGWDRASAALFLGMGLALLAVVVLFDMVRAVYMRRRFRAASHLRPRVTGILLGLVLVVISRVSDFQPGYLYGDFTALVFAFPPPKERDEGAGIALATVLLGAASLGAWFLLDPIRESAAEPDAAFLLVVASSALASLWVSGLGAIVFGLAPIKYFQGKQVRTWSTLGWLVLYGSSIFAFVHVLAHPESGFYGQSSDTTLVEVLSLFIAFGLFSVAFWAYFRFRDVWRKSRGKEQFVRRAS